MATAPKIPREQRNFADHGAAFVEDAGLADRRDHETGVQSVDPDDADVNPGQQGRYGNLKQNLNTHWRVQER
jgi:hypothetical protein